MKKRPKAAEQAAPTRAIFNFKGSNGKLLPISWVSAAVPGPDDRGLARTLPIEMLSPVLLAQLPQVRTRVIPIAEYRAKHLRAHISTAATCCMMLSDPEELIGPSPARKKDTLTQRIGSTAQRGTEQIGAAEKAAADFGEEVPGLRGTLDDAKIRLIRAMAHPNKLTEIERSEFSALARRLLMSAKSVRVEAIRDGADPTSLTEFHVLVLRELARIPTKVRTAQALADIQVPCRRRATIAELLSDLKRWELVQRPLKKKIGYVITQRGIDALAPMTP